MKSNKLKYTLTSAALFAAATAAAQSVATKDIWSVENQTYYTVGSGEYVKASGYYYKDASGVFHRGPVVNVGTFNLNGIFESNYSASAQSLFDAGAVLGSGELRVGAGIFVSPTTDMSGFNGKISVFADNETRKPAIYFVSSTNNPANASFDITQNGAVSFTNGDYTLNGKIAGAGTLKAEKLSNITLADGTEVVKNSEPAKVVVKGYISGFSGGYAASDNSTIRLETTLADSVKFSGSQGGSLELVGGAGDAKKTVTVSSGTNTTTSGNVYMYGNKAVIAQNSNDAGTLGANGGTIYFGGKNGYSAAEKVSHTFDTTTVTGNTAGNVVVGGKGTGASMEAGADIVVDGVKIDSLVAGGAEGASVNGDINVTVKSGTVASLSGGKGGIHTGNTNITVENGSVANIYGGDQHGGQINGDISVNVKDGTVGTIYGANYVSTSEKASDFNGVNGNVKIDVSGGTVNHIRGGINSTNAGDVATAKSKMVLNGNVEVNVSGNAHIGANDGESILATGGSYGSVNGNTTINISDNAVVDGIVAGGASRTDDKGVKSTYINVKGGTLNGDIYGGGLKYSTVTENTNVNISGGTVNANVYGGGQLGSTVEGKTVVCANGGVINGDIYGGGRTGGVVNKQTYVQTHEGATVAGNVYGGGENDTVKGYTQIEIYGNSDIKGDIYGGGKGADSKVLGNSWIRFVSNSNFTGTVDGAGQDGGTVAGSRALYFGGWQNGDKWDGDFNGKIKNINSIVLTNGSNVSNLKFDMAEPMSFGGEGTLEVITNLDGKNIDSTYLVNVLGSSPFDITFKNSTFSGNAINNNSYGVFLHWGAGKMAFDGTTIADNSISRNDDEKIQGILYYNGSGGGEVVNTVLKNNTVSATQVQSSGVFAYMQNLDIKGSQFIGNKSIGSNGSKLTNGAVYVENQSDTAKIVNISDTLFDGNSAENTGEASMGKGGALAVVKRVKSGKTLGEGVEVVLNDAAFTNNSAGMGGAIYVGGETLTLNATKSATFSGNTATNGGFLYMDNGEADSTASAKVSLNVADGATLTIGTTSGASDSIAGIESATLSKLGAGSLNVNGSMADFKGSLIVSAGVMNANNGLGAKSVSIANGATLGVALGNGALENASVANNGTLSLKRGTLADGATFVLSNYSGEGAVKAYGGILSGGTFTAGKSESFVSSAITVGTGANDVQSVKLSDKLSLDFDVSGLGEAALTVNEIKASTDLGGIKGDVLAAFDVDLIDNGNTYSVVFSAHVGAVEDASKLLAWHKGADGVWTKLDTAIDYADEIASIMVDGFSSYAFSQVPEPSTYAAIAGVIALALAAWRRRK